MFERYTEQARRVIFFARYEAGVLGARYIECPHMVLAMLRENGPLRRQLDTDKREDLRRTIVSGLPQDQPISTSIDLPLSQETRRALSAAAEEATRATSEHIDALHLLLGVIDVHSDIAKLLRQF